MPRVSLGGLRRGRRGPVEDLRARGDGGARAARPRSRPRAREERPRATDDPMDHALAPNAELGGALARRRRAKRDPDSPVSGETRCVGFVTDGLVQKTPRYSCETHSDSAHSNAHKSERSVKEARQIQDTEPEPARMLEFPLVDPFTMATKDTGLVGLCVDSPAI